MDHLNAPDYTEADIAAKLAELDETHAARLNMIRAGLLTPWQVERKISQLEAAYFADCARWEQLQADYY